ncbi:MAG: prepilin-type N-terminal cleavage/methylation domain-containing protein [Deltaproteobacteria bacterium]|nr:prepilin-type N-terminal cleavage/methylation domain-containing protein [Deltaproteobacteria bacterium]
MTPISVVKRQVKPNPNNQGLTLIEIMVVIALVATIMALGVTVITDVSDSDLKEASSRLSGTLKYVFNEAAIQKKYYRIVIDLDSQQYYAEARTSPFLISINQEVKAPTKKPEEKPEATSEPEELMQQPEGDDFAKVEEYLIEPQQLSDPVKIVDVFVGHLAQKATTGKVEIYFFPHGWTEPTVINLTNGEEDNYYSIIVNPATGKAEIKNEYTEANITDHE